MNYLSDDDSDLIGLSSEERQRRAQIRNAIRASLPRSETAIECVHRQRTEAIHRAKVEAQERERTLAQSEAEAVAAQVTRLYEILADWCESLPAAIDTRIDNWMHDWLTEGGRDPETVPEEECNLIWATIGKFSAMERREIKAEIKNGLEELRRDFEGKLISLRERAVDLVSRPAVDQDRVDRAIESAAARFGAELGEQREKLTSAIEALRRETGDKIVALRERTVDALTSRPALNQDRTDRAIEIAATKLRLEFGDLIEARERGVDARLADLEAWLKSAAGKLPVAKEWREGGVAYQGDLFSHRGALWQSRRDTGREPGDGEDWACVARGGEVVEGDAPAALDQRLSNAHRQMRAEAAEEQARMLEHVEGMITAVEKHWSEALASRPAFNRDQIDCVVEVAVARASAKLSETFDRALEAALETQRREFAVQVQALKERIVDIASRPSSDQSQIERTAAAAVEITVAKLRAELADQIAAQDRGFEARLADLEAEGHEFPVQLQALKERVGDIAGPSGFDQVQIEHAAKAAVETAVARLRLGLDDMLKAQARVFDAQLADLEARLKGAAGKLPVAKAWSDGLVTYEGEIVTYGGAAWQAVRDTAQAPGGTDWLPIAKGGRDGANGRSIVLCGTYDMRESYAAMDIVAYEGQSFIAARDNPIGLPGDSADWLLIAARGVKGERGLRGSRGPQGDKGETGATAIAWKIDRERYRASPLMSDGTVGPMLELRPLFEQYQIETG